MDIVMQTLNQNMLVVQAAIRNLAKSLSAKRDCNCENALASALVTDPGVTPAETRQKLDLLVKKYIK